MGWLGKGLSRGGIVPHGRGDDPEPRAVGLPALPDGYWFVVKRFGGAVFLSVERGDWLSVERGDWLSFEADAIVDPTEAKVRKSAMKMARDVHAHADARARADSVVKAFTK